MASSDATAIPIKNQAYRVTFPILDADGDLVTGATGLDSKISLDSVTFSDVTAEATEIAASSGMYFLDLTAAEMNANTVAIIVKTTSSGAKTTPIVLYPKENGDITVALDTQGKADVNAEVDSALDTAIPGSPTTDSINERIVAIDGQSYFDPSTTPVELLASGGSAGKNVEEIVDDIDAELTINHGAGSWGAGGTVVLPVMQGEVYSAVAVQNKEVTIVKGDTPRIIFDLESDYTGWTIWFGAKEKMSDTTYAISVREVTWSDASLGQGYIDLSATDTDLMGKFFAELELRQGAQRLTAMKYTLVIIDDVIDA